MDVKQNYSGSFSRNSKDKRSKEAAEIKPSKKKESKKDSIDKDLIKRTGIHEIFNSFSEGIIYFDFEGKILDVNDSLTEISLFKKSQLIGHSLFELIEQTIDPAQVQDVISKLKSVLTKKKLKPFELNYRDKQLEISTVLEGNKNHIISIIRDITDKKHFQLQIQAEKQFMEEVFSSIQDGISVLDKDLNIIHVNPVMEKWYAKNLPLIGKKCYQCYHDVDKPCEPCPSLRSLQSGKFERDIVQGLGDSDVKWLELFSYPMRDAQSGAITGVVEFVRNITAQTEAVQQLKQSEETYRNILDSLDEAVYIQDENGIFIDVNKGAERMYGLNRQELIGASPQIVSAEGMNDLQMVAEKVNDALNGKPASIEFWGKRKNGEFFPKEVHLYPSIYFGRKVVLAIAQDISERKKKEAEIKESEEKFRILAESAPILISIVADSEGSRFLYANHCWLDFFGFKRSGIKEIRPIDTVHPEMKEEVIRKARQRLKSSGTTGRYELKVITREGETKILDFTSTPIIFGKNRALLTMAIDITERKEYLAKLMEKEERYRSFVNATDDLVFLKDSQFRYLFTNLKNAEFLQKPIKEIISRTDSDLMPPEAARMCLISDKSAQKSTGVIKTEELIGDKIYEVRKFPVHLLDGSIGVGGIIRDITQRKKNESELIESETRLRSFFESPVFGSVLSKLDGRILQANEEFLRITGYSRKDLQDGKVNWRKLTPPKFISIDEENIKIAKATNASNTYEKQFIRKDRSLVWVLVGFTVYGEDSDQFMAFVIDIDARKKSEVELHKHRKHLDELVEEQTEKLQKKYQELLKLNNLFVTRELRMKEMRDRIIELEEKLKRYE